MSVKNLCTIKPVGYRIDKKGNRIAVYRGGILDGNKYAKKTPLEQSMEAGPGNPNYQPPPTVEMEPVSIAVVIDPLPRETP